MAVSRRSAQRVSQSRESQATVSDCSCDLLIELTRHPHVQGLLRAAGVAVDHFERGKQHLHQRLASEPADWLHRIRQRGARGIQVTELDELLAITRSADCHGYRLLELCGAQIPQLRKEVMQALSAHNSHQRSAAPVAYASRVEHDLRDLAARPSLRRSQQQARDPAPASGSDHLAPLGSAPKAKMATRSRAAGTEIVPDKPYASLRQSRRDAEPLSAPSDPLREAERHRKHPGQNPDYNPGPNLGRHFDPQPETDLDSDADADGLGSSHAASARSKNRGTTLESSPGRVKRVLRSIVPAQLGELFGRDAILRSLADAVSRERPRLPLLVGESGSGRSELAQQLAKLVDAPIFALQAPHYRQCEDLRRELALVAEHRGIVIFDDLDRVATEQPPEILPALVECWAQAEPRIVTICSHETRARLEQWLPGVLASLDTLNLPPLDGASVHQAVNAKAPLVLAQHGVQWGTGGHASEATRLAERYLGGLAMPGRALDLIDLASARARREGQSILDSQRLREVVAQRTGLPLSHIYGSGERDLLDLEQQLSERVVGHEKALSTIAALVRRNRAGFRSQRPIASVLLLGPSGIGKTELAKALASALFSSEEALLRLDMSEYSEAHAVARVVGAPPGYVGHEQGGALTDPMIDRPHRIVLLDEIEKAHRDVHQLLLQVLDEGRLTDGRGRSIDFRHSIIVMTSNLGAEVIQKARSPAQDKAVLDTVAKAFPVELWNRIEAPLVMYPLSRTERIKILRRLARRSSQQLQHDRGLSYELDEKAESWLLGRAGQDPSLGARPLRHLLSRHVETLIADRILDGSLEQDTHWQVSVRNNALVLDRRPR